MDTNCLFSLLNESNVIQSDIEYYLEMFRPLVKKYSRMLAYEDAEQEIILKLIELRNNEVLRNKNFSNRQIVAYVSKAMKNEYIRLSKKNNLTREHEIFTESNPIESCEVEFLDNYLFNELICNLSKKSQTILTDIFVNQLSEVEIASKLGVTKQAVSNMKRRSLKKLKEKFDLDCKMFVG